MSGSLISIKPMRNLKLALLCACLFLSAAHADDRAVAVDKALTQVQEQKAVAQSWEGQNADKPYVVLLNEYETKLNPDWSYEETYHTRIKIQKDAAKELGQ